MTKVPLPFVGNKGRYVSFQKVIAEMPKNITDVYDLFGGSFFCGYLVKKTHPNINVHINKYASNYLDRLHKFSRTKTIIEHLQEIINVPNDSKLSLQEAKDVKNYLYTLDEDEDWQTICCYICYKTNAISKTKEELLAKPYSQFYNMIPKHLNSIPEAINKYLEVLSKCDFFECDYFDFKYDQDIHNTLYIVDPPYLNTTNHTYESIDANHLLYIFSELFTNKNMIYFGSEKNDLFVLLEHLKDRKILDIDIVKTLRKNSHVMYYDIMIVRRSV